jgi:hypothetical protein
VLLSKFLFTGSKERMMSEDMKQSQQTAAEAEPWGEAIRPYREARERLEDAEADVLAAAKVALKAGSRALFDKHPGLQSFGWRHIGNVCCRCGAGEAYVLYDEPDINGIHGQELAGTDMPDAKRQAPVEEFLRQFCADHLLELYGSHQGVTMHRSGAVMVDGGYCEDDDCDEDGCD